MNKLAVVLGFLGVALVYFTLWTAVLAALVLPAILAGVLDSAGYLWWYLLSPIVIAVSSVLWGAFVVWLRS